MDTRRIVSFLAIPVGQPVESFFVSYAKDILKPRVDIQPSDEWYLTQHTSYRTIEEITVVSDGRELQAHKLQLTSFTSSTSAERKKFAIIYMAGNCPEISDSLPSMEPLLKQILEDVKLTNKSDEVICYFQHYRGRGTNKITKQENFSDYTQMQDAIDQAMLIKKLVDEGYKQENILLIGYSYGSAVMISAIHYLVTHHGYAYINLKSFSDRGYGNPFDLRFLKPIIYDHNAAQKRLHEKGMLPEIPLHNIVVEYMPYSFILHVKNDQCIWFDFSLANTFKENELQGRIVGGEAKAYANPHFADRANISLSAIPELNPHHFMTAMLLEIPLHLQFDVSFLKSFEGYALTKDAKPGDKDYLEYSYPKRVEVNLVASDALVVVSKAVQALLEKLNQYCLNRAERGITSGLGGDYNKTRFSSTGLIGWTVKQQIEMAMRIMFCLYDIDHNAKQLSELALESGPHQSGELKNIFTFACEFANEYKEIIAFNNWVTSMAINREKQMQKRVLAKDELMNEWVVVEEKVEKVQNENTHLSYGMKSI